MFRRFTLLRHCVYDNAVTPSRIIFLPIESNVQAFPEVTRMFRPCLVLKCKARKQTAPYMQLLCKTRIEIWQIAAVCVWVRNAIKIAAVLSASNHEKECCCCFLSHCPACRRFVLSCCENTSQAYIKDILIGAVLCWKRRMSFFLCL